MHRNGSISWSNSVPTFNVVVDVAESGLITVTSPVNNISFNWTETRLLLGSVGVLSSGVGAVTSLAVNTTCDGGNACLST